MSQMAYKPWQKTETLTVESILYRLPWLWALIEAFEWGYKGGLPSGESNVTRVSGVLARFRDIDFNGYRHCEDPNTPIEAIRNPARQDQSRDVKVGDNPTARRLSSFGKEIEGHTIQQGSVRVNNGMQQDIGELATHTSPLS
ncbi:hypothetical protein R3P38DRAFT_2778692 [Favolaschia claudopus]|uniref:Uncharacterized protein n=1 Tax=Favolaschia claudopus TaxID=2862362 RepID=A0AAW0BE19_9AGAR